jgi:hypothetical protein
VIFQFSADVDDELKFTIWFELSEDGQVLLGLLGIPLTGISDENISQRRLRIAALG